MTAKAQAMHRIAEAIGRPGAHDPEQLADWVTEAIACLRAAAMPDDDELRQLVRAWSGLEPRSRVELRLLAALLDAEESLSRELAVQLLEHALAAAAGRELHALYMALVEVAGSLDCPGADGRCRCARCRLDSAVDRLGSLLGMAAERAEGI